MSIKGTGGNMVGGSWRRKKYWQEKCMFSSEWSIHFDTVYSCMILNDCFVVLYFEHWNFTFINDAAYWRAEFFAVNWDELSRSSTAFFMFLGCKIIITVFHNNSVFEEEYTLFWISLSYLLKTINIKNSSNVYISLTSWSNSKCINRYWESFPVSFHFSFHSFHLSIFFFFPFPNLK